MTTPRDSQRSKLYKAERLAAEKAGLAFSANSKETLGYCHAYIQQVLTDGKVVAAFPRANLLSKVIRLNSGAGCRNATWSQQTRTITLPIWARTAPVMLHELAHALAPNQNEAAHGWEFASRLLLLWGIFLGAEAAAELKQAYKECGVRYKAPRVKRELTEEQRQILRDRLAAARALRVSEKQAQ